MVVMRAAGKPRRARSTAREGPRSTASGTDATLHRGACRARRAALMRAAKEDRERTLETEDGGDVDAAATAMAMTHGRGDADGGRGGGGSSDAVFDSAVELEFDSLIGTSGGVVELERARPDVGAAGDDLGPLAFDDEVESEFDALLGPSDDTCDGIRGGARGDDGNDQRDADVPSPSSVGEDDGDMARHVGSGAGDGRAEYGERGVAVAAAAAVGRHEMAETRARASTDGGQVPGDALATVASSTPGGSITGEASAGLVTFGADVESELDDLLLGKSGSGDTSTVSLGAAWPDASSGTAFALERVPEHTMNDLRSDGHGGETRRPKTAPTTARRAKRVAKKVPGSTTAYVGNLRTTTSVESVRAAFSSCNIRHIRRGIDAGSGLPRTFAHVVFETDEDLERAMAMDGKLAVDGNVCILQYSHDQVHPDKKPHKQSPSSAPQSRSPPRQPRPEKGDAGVGVHASGVSRASVIGAAAAAAVAEVRRPEDVSSTAVRDVNRGNENGRGGGPGEANFWRNWRAPSSTNTASAAVGRPVGAHAPTASASVSAAASSATTGVEARANRGKSTKKGKDSKMRVFQVSDGRMHLGSALDTKLAPSFPGPKSNTEGGREGPPLRFLPIGGLGEIGMNCMLIAHYDRYILLDAGLMFPDFDEFGMQKVLPDTSFIARYKNKIEAIVISHGHEDHIGALPWVFPALDQNIKLYATKFTMQLVKKKMLEFGLWDQKRFVTVDLGSRFPVGPFEAESFRVTHSIPDCIGLVLRCEDGTILHTGDWKIDEKPVDGEHFDREALERIGKEGVTLMMSDSTNVLSPGRTIGEGDVERNLHRAVEAFNGGGRLIVTQFASNLARLGSVKRAADAAGRSVCLLGRSFETYLNCARLAGVAPFSMNDLIDSSEIDMLPDDKLLIVTTGSQGEPNAQLSLAASGASRVLKLQDTDRLLYSAKCIPGNDAKVMGLMNEIARCGTSIVMGREAGLHCSGHGCNEEQREVIRLVNPQHFLPVHGEYTFLQAHAGIARECGVQHTSVIHDGQLLGVYNLRNRNEVSRSSATLMGEVNLRCFYNDGGNATGDNIEQRLAERMRLADTGMIIASIEIQRPGEESAAGLGDFNIEVQCKCMYTNKGEHIRQLRNKIEETLRSCAVDVSLKDVEQGASKTVKEYAHKVMKKRPDVCVFVHEVRDLNEARQVSLTHRTEARSGRVNRNVPPPAPPPSSSSAAAASKGTSGRAAPRFAPSRSSTGRHKRTDRPGRPGRPDERSR